MGTPSMPARTRVCAHGTFGKVVTDEAVLLFYALSNDALTSDKLTERPLSGDNLFLLAGHPAIARSAHVCVNKICRWESGGVHILVLPPRACSPRAHVSQRDERIDTHAGAHVCTCLVLGLHSACWPHAGCAAELAAVGVAVRLAVRLARRIFGGSRPAQQRCA